MGTPRISSSALSALIALAVLSQPAHSASCSLSCQGSSSSPSFLDGHTYNYGVDGTVSVYVTGAEKQETGVKVFGQVSVSALGNCALSLKVNSLTISGPDGKKYSSPPGIDKAVRFSLQDGRVGAEICAEEGDTRRSLNIKRAIISLLQTELKPSTQVDVFGSCYTEVSSSQEGGATLVHRSRDLSRCAHREQGRNEFLTAVYNPTSEIKNTQVLQSTLNVESKVNNGVPEKVSATEEYLYRPFSVGDNGARAEVHTKLTMTGSSQGGANPGNCPESRTIIFENPHGAPAEQSNLKNILDVLKETCKSLKSEASSKSAGKFAQVIRVLRASNKDDLIKIYNQVKGNSLEKRVFLDGLLRAGTGYSIEASIQILKGKELSDLEEKLVFLSLGNAQHVNDEAIKAAASILDSPDIPKEVYLGVGALAGVYCKQHNCHSSKSEGIAAVSKKFAAKLQNCKPKSKVEEDYVVAVLKGIRNVKHLENNLIDKVVHCAVDDSVKARVRVAALEAFLADPCAAKVKSTALELMKNRQLDSEIRIKAYLAVIGCPCGKSANVIKNLLDSEQVHQVGRFITTSLRQIRSSSNPDKQLARLHYGQIGTPNKFNVDDRKYSFYREASYNLDALGMGGNVEQTVIYSQDSFLPRSGSLNLTTEIFGHNLNVLEIGARQGNLDRVIEHFLGPKGFFKTHKAQEIYDNLVERLGKSKEKVEHSLGRHRRSVKSEIDNFDKKVKAESVPYNNELDFDVYLKLFGTDAVFLSLGDDKGFNFDNVLDQLLNYVSDGMNKARNFQNELRGHLLFLDAELSYPTSTGFPLRLDLVGAATARVDVATNVDIRQCIRNPENAKVDIKLIPSIDVEVSGVMLIDADAVSTGLKVITNLHSSTGGHLIAKVIENGQGFDIQFGLPVDKQEILDASNELVYFSAEKGQIEKVNPVKIDSNNKEYKGCFDQLSDYLGLTLCGEVSVPFSVSGPEAQSSISKFIARYPLTGPATVKLVLEKNNLRGYHVKGVLRRDARSGKYGAELLFDAEGCKTGRIQLNGDVVISNEEKSIKLALNSPFKVLSGEVALYTKESKEYAVLAKAKVDDSEYYGRLGFDAHREGSNAIYKPVLEYLVPDNKGKQVVKVDGEITHDTRSNEIKWNLKNINALNMFVQSNDPLDLHGHYKPLPNGYELDVKGKMGQHTLLFDSSLKGAEFKLELQNTLNPYVNFKVNAHFENHREVNHNDIDLWYGGDLRNTENRITISQFYKRYEDAKEFSVITKNKFEICALPLKIKADAQIDHKKVDIDIEGQYLNKKAELEVEARTHIKKPGDYSVKVKAEVDRQGVEVFAKRDIVSADKSNFENSITIKGVGKYELSGVVLHKNKANDMNVGAVGHLKVSGGGKNEDIKFDIGVIENTNLYSSHAKLSSSKGEILEFLLKINRGANANGQLKFILKDAISANGQFKVTDNDGKGNGMIIVDFQKAQRKIKGDVKFVVKDPVYNAEVDVFLNFEKDNADKLHISTSNKKTDKLVDSKNKFEYAGKKTEVNVHQSGEILEGKYNANVEVVLPTERCLNLKFNRDVTDKDNTLNGNAELVLSDSEKRGQAGSVIIYKGKLTDTNYEKNTLDYEGEIELKLKNGKQLLNSFSMKNAPLGDGKFKGDVKIDLKGNLIPKPASLVASSTYNDNEIPDENYRLKANYGEDMGLELVGGVLLKTDGDIKKYVDENTLSLRLPFEKAHDIKLVSNVQFIQPEDKDFVEFTVIESIQVNADVYKIDSNGKISAEKGSTEVKVLVPHHDALVLQGNYEVFVKKDVKAVNVEVQGRYGKIKRDVKLVVNAPPHELDLLLVATAPESDKLKKLEFKINSKNPAPSTYNNIITIQADDRVYKSEGVVVYSKTQPLFDYKYTSPSNTKPSRLYVKGDAVSSSHGKLEVKVENIKNVDIDASCEGNVQKDNIFLKAQVNSAALGLKNYKMDISSKDAGSGKRLEFHAVNDGKNLLSGSTSFISKQEGTKTIIEGSGSVKVKDDQKPANFKYIRTILSDGSETFLNLAFGERSYVAESRITELEYKTSYLYCEEKKQCANIDLHSKINVIKPGHIEHVVNVDFDLRKLGFAPEFGLQISNEISELFLPKYILDLHVNKNDKKYHLHVYCKPERGLIPAGVTVAIPSRVLALESQLRYAPNGVLLFPIRGEVALYPDKNKPQQKTAAKMAISADTSDSHSSFVADFGFSHPKLGEELSLKVNGKLDRPQENSIKIESSAVLSHSCFGGKRESKVCLEANPTHVKFTFDTPLVKVIDLEGSAVVKDNLQQGDIKFSLLEGKPVQVHAVAKDYQYYEFTTGYSDDSERKLSIVSHLQPEKRVDIAVDIVLPGHKKSIVHGAVFLQDNLVKSEYGLSKENFNYFVNALKKDLGNLQTRVKELGDKNSEEIKRTLDRIQPTFKRLEQSYQEDLEKIVHEITNDETLKEVSEALHIIAQYIAKTIDDVLKITKPMVNKIVEIITDLSEKTKDLYVQQLEPQIKQLYANVAAVIEEYFDGLLDAAAHFSALVMDFFERHKPEIEELTNTLSEIFKDLTKLLVAQLKEWRVKVVQIFEELSRQINELPVIGALREKWQELAIPEQAAGLLKQAQEAIRQVLPTEEAKVFSDELFTYITKKLKQEKVDEAASLRVLYEKFAQAVASVVQFIRSNLGDMGISVSPAFSPLSLPSFSPVSAPSLGGSASFSLLNQLMQGDLPDPIALIRAYRPRSLNPLDEIPSRLRAVVVNGQHIFTFDGRHLTFPGNCRYVLAHDYVDRNFTLLIQLQNGAPKSLILEDKNGAIIEIKENGQVALNGANHGYPAIDKDSYGFRTPNGNIGLESTFGVRVICYGKLEACYIEVNGFYLGKLRGLLGDGNNEPFDDFRMPNGKISSSESEFGNAYRLAGSCPAVKTPEHSHHQMHHMPLPPACEIVFGGSSPLRPLSLVLDVAPFRQACIHAASGDSAEALAQACSIGRGYAGLALTGLLPVVLPARCVSCTDTDKERNIGDTYELKLPAKQADIVIGVETTVGNEKNYKELLVPLVSQLIDNLKSKRIGDIKVYLVGITSKFPYPIVYDTDLKLKNPKMLFNDQSRYEKIETIKTGYEKIDEFEQTAVNFFDRIKKALGISNVLGGYKGLLELPLRPGAVKHTITLVSDYCEKRDLLISTLRAAIFKELFSENAHSNSIITNTPELSQGDEKLKHAAGYTKKSVLICGDKKQKDTEALRATIKPTDNECINFIEGVDGFVFSASNYEAMNPGMQKQFLQTAAGAISKEMLSEVLVQECTCTYTDPFRVHSVCINKERKEAARRRK